jgi:hypothetical protein
MNFILEHLGKFKNMNITTFSNPSSYSYHGLLATYFSDTTFKDNEGNRISPIDETLKNNALWMADPSGFNDSFDCKNPIVELNPDPQNQIIRSANETFFQGMGIRCFVKDDETSQNDQLMWAHYANKANGICLVFDPEKDDELFCPNDIVGVEYFEKPFPLKLWEKINNWTTKCSDFLKAKCYSVGIKSTQWQYENEVRLVKACYPNSGHILPECINNVDNKGDSKLIEKEYSDKFKEYMTQIPNARNFHFEKESLVEIRFGHGMKDSRRIQEIKNLLKDNGYNHIKYTRSTPNSKEYKIDYISC